MSRSSADRPRAILEIGGIGPPGLQRRDEREAERQDERRGHACRHDSPIDRGVAEQSRLWSGQPLEQRKSPSAEHETGRARRQRDQQAFNGDLLQMVRALCAERGSHRELALPADRLREHDVRDVGARHGRDERRDQREQDEQRLNFSAELFDEGPDDDPGLRVGVRVIGLESIGDARRGRLPLVPWSRRA